MWEWVAGLRIVGGEIQIIPYGNCMRIDCDMSEDSTEWKAIKPDGTFVNPGTAGTLHYDFVSGKIVIGTSTNSTFANNTPLSQVAAASGVSIPQIVKALGLMKDTNDIYPATGHQLYVNTDGERLPFRGSGFLNASYGGLGALDLSDARSFVFCSVGFRSAFDEKLATGN